MYGSAIAKEANQPRASVDSWPAPPATAGSPLDHELHLLRTHAATVSSMAEKLAARLERVRCIAPRPVRDGESEASPQGSLGEDLRSITRTLRTTSELLQILHEELTL